MPRVFKGDPATLSNHELAQILEDWASNRERARQKEGAWEPDILENGARQLREAARRLRETEKP